MSTQRETEYRNKVPHKYSSSNVDEWKDEQYENPQYFEIHQNWPAT